MLFFIHDQSQGGRVRHRCSAAAATVFAALALAACGSGGDGDDPGPAARPDAARERIAAVTASGNWVTVDAPADPLLDNLAVAADAPTRGMWSGVQAWPLNGLHAAVLPNGKLLTYGTNLDGGQQNGRYLDLWDPTLGFANAAHTTTYRAEQQDSFCAAATYLTDGRLLVSGGNGGVTSTFYTPSNNAVAQSSANMADDRWYATMLTLPDGRPLILGGMAPYAETMQDNPDQAVARGLASMTPEVYENGAWRSLPGAYSRDAFGPDYLRASYPRSWVAPSGKVFGVSAERMWSLDPGGNGSITTLGAFKQAPGATAKPNVGATNSAVMYDIGKVLLVGGNGSYNADELPASKLATQIDINGAAPVLTEQPAMANARRYPNAIVLPDGKVVVTGGATYGNFYSGQPAAAVYAAEIWDPATGTWRTGASAAIYRGYHSFTVLLPNGTILSTGGGTPGPVTNLNAEVYYPPQLFTTVNGTAKLATRPVMKAISGLSYANEGQMQIDMASGAAVSRLALIGLSVGTHSFNAGQRRIPLAFTQDNFRLTATLPGSTVAPPGYYQVVAIDAAGVPSRGAIVAIGQGVQAPPVSTTPYTPPDTSGAVNAPIIAAGGTASFSYPASTGASYSWDFGDGSAATAFSTAASATHVYTQAGIYAVTLTARAADGSTARRSIVQAVANAATAKSPTASSAVALTGQAAPATTANLAPSATLATSYVSAWEKLSAVNDNATPANSADHSAGAYGNWNGTGAYGATHWVSFSWSTPKVLTAFDVYWWNDGQGIATPKAAQVEYWNGNAWVAAGAIGTALNTFNRAKLNVTTTQVRVAMSSAAATGILEARVYGAEAPTPYLWVANPDTNTVAVFNTATRTRVAEVAVGQSPRSVALAPDGRAWVVNKDAASISILSPTTLQVVQTVGLPRASRPHGLAFAPGGSAYVVLEATGQLLKLDPSSGAQQAALAVGTNPRHVSVSADGATVLVSRFITPPLPGENTAKVDTSSAGAEVVVVNAAAMTIAKTTVLRHSDKADSETQGSGIPNYLGAAVVSPDGKSAWVPSKQDNIKRGMLRSGQNLDFQNTVRAISSRIDMGTLAEDLGRRIDHDNASLASAAAFHPSGAYLFVALETSRQVAVVDPVGGHELFRVDVGRAPQALSVSADGRTLYVQNYMDRTVSVLDLAPLVNNGELRLAAVATLATVGTELLPAQVLVGKQLFYDARDPRLARDAYMSCAACHSDAGHDGRVWDLTGLGEGLRNTVALKGRAGTGHGFLHWSANFDEVQDFEKQIRDLAGGLGLMSDALYNAGTRNQALGDKKAGLSTDLDALAAYLGSLNTFDPSPLRNANGTLTTAAAAGKTVFQNANCASCHGGTAFTSSVNASSLRDIGTIKSSSGKRLGGALTGIDPPTLRDVWASAPYLHDGSAPTLAAAVQAHAGNTVTGTDLGNLVAYLQQIGSEEAAAPAPVQSAANLAPSATLTTSFVSNWESLAAVNNNIVPANSADKTGGAYGNWNGTAAYGATNWVRLRWGAPKTFSAFEVYWWNDGQGIATPTAATVWSWNGTAWVSLGDIQLALNTFNRLNFAPVTTDGLYISMRSARATGILELRAWGY
ncbi:galactose oxidase-like domain-containing protein [Pseudorhodoferax sp. Leaf274]|uniref:galactose oxidase-like domain-containing protein n=1 Tax=Pseudorhodoferax sp. Leaf274 TaxID=1736318 RepID=UPI000702D88C|nr:galactose oxidase-like domain-containing protein [Pseudorhodoferax sp. Leaf274]KQP37364.1 hypothetical protein ASF44_13465 [Pseudorhodoferax sp. Leaf274]